MKSLSLGTDRFLVPGQSGTIGPNPWPQNEIIHLTDTHVVGEGTLYDQDPAAGLRAAVASINREHGDADFVVLTGGMTHWGDAAAYERFSREIGKLNMPAHLMVGNHDDTAAFGAAFPEIPRDENGFVQSGFETRFGRFLLLDTKTQNPMRALTAPRAKLGWIANWTKPMGQSFCSCTTRRSGQASSLWT